MNHNSIRTSVLCIIFWSINSECPNACSAHGTCGARDVCTCNRNWMGSDCSQRMFQLLSNSIIRIFLLFRYFFFVIDVNVAGVCQFGMAHVDTPRGDLDSSQVITGPKTEVLLHSQLYPFGTTEQYPNMVNTNDTVLPNTAHSYAECSNKGFCDRKYGTCSCLTGYSGSSCQYTSCLSVSSVMCNGHGTCETAATFAKLDNNNTYSLWDENSSRGCRCDAGYYGPGCNFRRCKYGFDPMFYDLSTVKSSQNSFRFTNWSFVIAAKVPVANITGNYSIIFYDIYGEDWHTSPIPFGASCTDIATRLESLPNQVIPFNSVRCLRWPNYQSITPSDEPALLSPNPYNGVKYTLAFPRNPGKLKQFTTNIYLDGKRPTLLTTETQTSSLGLFVYPNGFFGSNTEYFATKCKGVDVTLAVGGGGAFNYLSGLTSIEFRLFAQCLGDADGLPTYSAKGRVLGVDYTWDYGSIYYPHLIRLVDQTVPAFTDLCNGREADSVRGSAFVCSYPYRPPGFITALYYNAPTNQFILLTRPGEDYSTSTLFAVFTTTGIGKMVSEQAKVYTDWTPYSNTIYTTNSSYAFPGFYGNVDCETTSSNVDGAFDCVEKGSMVFILDPYVSLTATTTTTTYVRDNIMIYDLYKCVLIFICFPKRFTMHAFCLCRFCRVKPWLLNFYFNFSLLHQGHYQHNGSVRNHRWNGVKLVRVSQQPEVYELIHCVEDIQSPVLA